MSEAASTTPLRYPAGWWHLWQSVQQMQAGGVIAYPTEAVWGLGCDPWNDAAVARLLQLKDRPEEKGVILVAASVAQVRFLLDPLDPALRERAEQFWPGPVTCLVPDVAEQVPPWIRGRHASVAVRVSDHPLVRRLCRAFGGPIVSTSANPAGRPSARSRTQVARYFGETLDYVMPGALGSERRPSRIIDLASGRQLR